MDKIKLTTLLIATALAFTSMTSVASPQQNNANNDENIEVITIRGELPPHYYTELKEQKTKEFMALYNEYVEDKDLAFRCRRMGSTGSHFKKEVCFNEFEWRIIRRYTDEQSRRGELPNFADALMNSKEKRERRKDFLASVQKMINEEPKLKTVYLEYMAAQKGYKQAHAKKFGEWSQYSQENTVAKGQENKK